MVTKHFSSSLARKHTEFPSLSAYHWNISISFLFNVHVFIAIKLWRRIHTNLRRKSKTLILVSFLFVFPYSISLCLLDSLMDEEAHFKTDRYRMFFIWDIVIICGDTHRKEVTFMDWWRSYRNLQLFFFVYFFFTHYKYPM